jgi:hypothetical protein
MRWNWALGFCVAAAGCSANPLSSGPYAATPYAAPVSSALRKGPRQLLYVSSVFSGGSAVSIFSQEGSNQKPIGEIRQGIDDAYGLFVDKHRNLYAANILSGTVTVYPPGATSPSRTMRAAGVPIEVVVAGNGTAYVVNDGDILHRNAGGSVLEYRKGATKPSKTIVTFAHTLEPRAVALDASGNLYVAYNHNFGASYKPRGRVLEFAPGSTQGKDLGIRIGQAGGLTIDGSGNLVLVQDGNYWFFPPTIDIFAPGHEKAQKIPAPYNYPGYDVALNAGNTEMWLTSESLGAVFGMSYPNGAILDTITTGYAGPVLGVATSPEGSE